MAFSNQRAVSDGTLQTVILSIAFFDKSEIRVYIDDQLQVLDLGYIWATSNSIQFPENLPHGSTVIIRRVTDISEMRHIFTAGAQFTNQTLDEDYTQILHIAQESVEGSYTTELFNDLDMHQYRVRNMAEAVLPGDAVPLSQVQGIVDANPALLRALRVPASDVTINELPPATARAGKVLGFDDAGQPVGILPATGSGTELALDLATQTVPAKGAGMVGYKGRTLHDRLSERVSIKDAPFSAKMDGVTDDGPALQMFCLYLQTTGVRGYIPEGTLYSKTYRPAFNVTFGVFKSFIFGGAGKNLTFLKFGDVSPVFAGDGVTIVTPEPALFSVLGLPGVNPHPYCEFEDFAVDYSEQVFRGGASISTPALTDIKPLSNGTRWMLSNFGNGVSCKNMHANEIYGNGITVFRSPNCRIDNCTAFNVSGGNIGLADSSGAFIILLAGAQVGTSISSCRAINTRTYLTDTIAGFTDRTSRGTPCGYIGICVEYPVNEDGLQAPGTEFWTGPNTVPPNFESMGCTIRDCLVYGYYMGIKSESSSPVSVTSCTSIACWMPFVISGSTGVVRDCYADRAWLDQLVQPMVGYRYVGGMYTHLDYTGNVAKAGGVVFDGCQSVVRSAPVFSTNGHNVSFLNQRTLMPLTGGVFPGIAVGRAGVRCRGVKVSGTVTVTGTATSSVVAVGAFDGLSMDLVIENKTLARMFVRLEGSPDSSLESDINVSTVGLVCIGSVGERSINLVHRAELTDPAVAFSGTTDSDRFLFLSGATSANVRSNINCHADATSGSRGLGYITGSDANVDLVATLPDVAGSVTCILSIQGSGFTFPRLRKVGALGTPMLNAIGAIPNCHVQYVRCADAPLFLGNAPNGPMLIDRMDCPALSTTGATEPNSATTIARGIAYMAGAMFKYLRPSAGGKQGIVCVSGGVLAQAWAASTAYAVGVQRDAGGRIYTCTTAGTSGTVAPTHTSGSATDGTVVWLYFGPSAVFKQYGSIDA